MTMLSESDRRRLAEIEWSLRIDDPRWVYRFERRRQRSRQWRMAGLLALLGWGMVLIGLGLAYRQVGLTVLGSVVDAVVLAVWFANRRRGRTAGGRLPRRRPH